MSSPHIKVAIVGGGIASMCLARGLSKNPSLDVQIYEARPDPGEAGQAFGLAKNAQKALELLDPVLREALDKAGGVRMGPSATIMIGVGPNAGTKVGEIDTHPQQINVGRGAFQRELQKATPGIQIHTGRRALCVELADDGKNATLHLEDGTTEQADAVIGCDGLNSVVRQAVLESHPSVKVTTSVTRPMWHTRIVVPIEEVIPVFGEDYCRNTTQMGWLGDGCCLITDQHDGGSAMQLITSWSTADGKPWPDDQPFRQISKEELAKHLEVFGEFGQKMNEVYANQPSIFAAAGKGHEETPTYIKGNACLLGDAAQSFPPAQGAGAGQAIEDALALSVLLSQVNDVTHIGRLFEVYDRIRRPRRSGVARSSREAGRFLYGKLEGVGLEAEKMRPILDNWASNVYSYDLDAMVAELRQSAKVA